MNQFVSNFKKDIKYRGQPPWYYKEQAILAAAHALKEIQNRCSFLWVPMPTSKVVGSSEYDDRLVDTLSKVGDIAMQQLITTTVNREAVHTSSSPRSLDSVSGGWQVHPMEKPFDRIILFDDVISSGAHFKAAKTLIEGHFGNVKVYGIFLARAVQPATMMPYDHGPA